MTARRAILIIAILTLLAVFWQVLEDRGSAIRMASGETGLDAFIPTPLTIVYTFAEDWRIILTAVSYTIGRALAGFAIGTSIGILMATLFVLAPQTRRVVFPFSFAVNSFPVVGFAPMIILAFGQGSSASIVFISALICYFPVLVNMDAALQRADRDLLDVVRVLNATPLQELWKLRFPLALPQLFTAMKLAMPASIIGATIGEWLGTRNGVGQLVTVALYQLKPGLLYASLIAITAISVAFIAIIALIQSRFFEYE